MKKNLMLLAVAAMALASCGGGFKQGPGGLLYNIVDDKSTPVVKEGDFISANLIAKTEGDSVLSNTYVSGKPISTLMQKPQFKGDIVAGVMMLSEGDSAIIKVNIDSTAQKGQPRPPGIKGKYIVFTIKVEKVIQKGTLSDQVFQDRVKAYFTAESDKMKKEEPAKLAKYIADKKLNVQKTASGVSYVINQQGSGPVPAVGDTVVVNYSGRLLNGKLFDTNIKAIAQADKDKPAIFNPMNPYQPIRFPVGEKKVIAGWDETLQLLNKGSKATIIVPSALGYGEQGGGPIPPFAALVFEVEMVDIVKPNPNAPKPAAPVQAQVPVK